MGVLSYFFFSYVKECRSRSLMMFNIWSRAKIIVLYLLVCFWLMEVRRGMKRGEAGRREKGGGEAERIEGRRRGRGVGRRKYWSWEDTYIHACPPPPLVLIHHHYCLNHSSSSFSTSSFSFIVSICKVLFFLHFLFALSCHLTFLDPHNKSQTLTLHSLPSSSSIPPSFPFFCLHPFLRLVLLYVCIFLPPSISPFTRSHFVVACPSIPSQLTTFLRLADHLHWAQTIGQSSGA